MLPKLRFPAFILLVVLISRTSAAQLSTGDIYSAIRNDDLAKLRGLATSKTPGSADDRGRTPLMLAAEVGSLDAMKALLDAGADVNAADSFGATPLMFAVRDIAKVRLLLDAGARVNDKSKQNQTPLLIASANAGAVETVRLLVAKGADAKAVGASGRTGLIMAANQNDLAMAQFFLDQGVNVNAVDATDKSGHTALMAAAAQGNAAIVKALIRKGADVNMATTDAAGVRNGPLAFKGRTALMMAAPYGSPELIRTLIEAHANVNARDVSGMTPLMFAVASENQDPEVSKILLAAGADPKLQSTNGETALDWERKYGNPAVLKLLNDDAPKTPKAVKKIESSLVPSIADFRSMLQTSVALLQRSSTEVTSSGGCVNCHHQILTGLAVISARGKSVPIDEAVASDQWKAIVSSLRGRDNTFVQRMDSGGGLDSVLYTLATLEAGHYPPDATTDAMVSYILSRQLSDGRWPREEASRAPLQDGDFYRVALAVSALNAYAPPALKPSAVVQMDKAQRWLKETHPQTTDDRAMHLIGLRQGASRAEIEAAAKALLALQRPDGGWGGNTNLESDAFATSEALCALFDSGTLSARDAAYLRGVQFLLATRAKDGSWHVSSRAPKFQPYFESGFPYSHDQWISAAATARAVVALSRYIP